MTKDILKWADAHMHEAEPMEVGEKGVQPEVYLLWMTPDPLGALAAMNSIYGGKVVRSLIDMTDEDRKYHWEQTLKAHLEAPLECVKFHFLIEGVDRSFTHQMVRQRTAVYAQESLRFAVKEGAHEEVVLPPHIAELKDDHPQRVIWDRAIAEAAQSYSALVDSGVPAEDARGLLPHATATRLHYITDLRGLKLHAGNRLCTQAQFHWRLVFAKMIDAIRNYSVAVKSTLIHYPMAQYEWQYKTIADSMLFRPVCFHLNRCPWQDDIALKRKCSIRDRVTYFADHGIPSTEWESHTELPSDAIQPAEWLADPDAAIRKPHA